MISPARLVSAARHDFRRDHFSVSGVLSPEVQHQNHRINGDCSPVCRSGEADDASYQIESRFSTLVGDQPREKSVKVE